MSGVGPAAALDRPADDPRHGAALAHGTFFNTLAFLASNLRGIFTFLVARILGSAALGTFGLAWAATDLASKIGAFGLDTSAIAFVARHEAAGDRAGSARVMRAALVIGIGLSVAVSAVGILFAGPVGRALGQPAIVIRATAVTLLALPGMAWYRVSNAVSRGMGVMQHDIYSRGLTESLGTAAALLVALFVGARDLAPEIAAVAGTLASAIVAFIFMRRLFRGPGPGGSSAMIAPLARASAPIAAYDFLNLGIMQMDLIMLGLFVGRVPGLTLGTLGVYAAAVEVAGGLRKVNQSFTPIFTPVVARQMAQGRIAEAQGSYAYLARWMLAALLPAIAVLALAGGAILRIYGPSFAAGATWVAIIAVACALNTFVALGETILMLERPHLNLINSLVAFASGVGADLLLIPRLGPTGAALGLVVPYVVYGLLRGVEIRYLYDWQWPWRAFSKPAAAALCALPAALAIRMLGATVVVELTAAAVYIGGYFLAWRFVGLDPQDRLVLDALFHRQKAAA